MGRRGVVVVTVLLVLSLLAVPVTAARPTEPTAPSVGSASDATGTIERSFVVGLTPDEPGSVEVRLTVRIPDSVRDLRVTLPPNATVTRLDGFSGTDDGYEWTGGATPSLTYDLPANRTTSGGRLDGRFTFADTGEWAIVPTPRAGLSYRATAEQTVTTDYATDGAGVAGRDLVYLGASTQYERTAAGERFTLVVPETARPREQPATILDSLAGAADHLAVGPRDDTHLVIVAPMTVAWGPAGLQVGERDFWVYANATVDSPSNVWIHEYVHTRQTYRSTAATRWTTEATAEYYAGLETLRQERIDFEQFRRHLGRAGRYDGVLGDPTTWTDVLVPYLNGALVAGELDRRIRLASDGEASLATVLRSLDGSVDRETFLSAVERAGNASTRSTAETYTQTETLPEPWSRAEHGAAFGSVPATPTATVTATPTPSATATVTATPTVTPSPDSPAATTTRTDGQPGYGVLAALFALAVLGVGRRYRSRR